MASNRGRSTWTTALESTKTKTTLLQKTTVQNLAPAKQIPKLSNEGFLKKLNDQLNKMKLKDATSPLLSKEVGRGYSKSFFVSHGMCRRRI